MSDAAPPLEPDPFEETLAPLPTKEDEDSVETSKPKAVTAEASPEGSQYGEGVEPGQGRRSSVLARVERLDRDAEDAAETTIPTEPRWKFWKRPNKRDRQLDTLRQGATEMVGLLRSIRDRLEGEHSDRKGLMKTLTPLPVAVESLQSMSECQAETGRTLTGLRKTLEQRAEKDGLMIRSLDRMGHTMTHVEETFEKLGKTLTGMDQASQLSAKNMELLGERVSDSGRFMNESFVQLREAERDFTNYLSRTSRRSGMAMAAVCSLLVVSVVAVGFMFRENRNLLTAVQQNGSLVVQVPRNEPKAEASHRLALFDEQLRQVDDGIQEPDREIVTKPGDLEAGGAEEIVPVDTEATGLLSISKPPPRE